MGKASLWILAAVPLCAFGGYYQSAETAQVRPIFLTGNVEEDFRVHAVNAKVCVCDELPPDSILQSWKLLGVKMLRRAAWDPEGSAEFFRRQAGFLAFAEGADGVWLEGERNFPDTWKRSLKEAKTDVEVAQYLDSLADEAIAGKDHRVRLQGRRVKWMFREFDFRSANLDRLRLEFVAYAKFLEQQLDKSPRDLPTAVPDPILPDVLPFVPGAPRKAKTVTVKMKTFLPLVNGVSFRADGKEFHFMIDAKVKGCRIRFYIPEADGKCFTPYEYVVNQEKDIGDHPRAPQVGAGLYRLEDRFGARYGWTDRRWRCVQRRSWGRNAPEPIDRDVTYFTLGSGKALNFLWMDLYGKWPLPKDGVGAVWYVIVDRLPGDETGEVIQLKWPTGAPVAFEEFANAVNNWRVEQRYKDILIRTKELFSRGAVERRYGYKPVKTPTCQLFDVASDAMFMERCLGPRIEADSGLAKAVHTTGFLTLPDYVKGDKDVRDRIWKSIDRLIYMGYDFEILRRDYLARRLAGKEPPAVKPVAVDEFKQPESLKLEGED